MARNLLLEELAVAANSTELPYKMTLYFDRETDREVKYAKTLFVAYQELRDIVAERNKLMCEMEIGRPSLQIFKCLEHMKKLNQSDVIQLLELKKMIGEAKLKQFKNHEFVKRL